MGPILPSLFQGPTSPAVGSILGLPDRTRVRPLKLSSWIVLSNSLSHVRGLLYFKVGLQFTYFYRDILVCRGVLHLHQSAGPARSVESGETVSGRFSWATGCQTVVSSWSVGVALVLGWTSAVVFSPVRPYGYPRTYWRRMSFPSWLLTRGWHAR